MSLRSSPKNLLLTLIFSLILLQSCDKQPPSNIKTIALTQIIEHKSIDAERAGFMAGLKDAGFEDGKNIKVEFENAQGNIGTAAQIATKFIGLHPSVIVAFSTPSAQSVVNAASKTDIPVVFSTVTDAVSAKIISKNEAPRTDNVTGVSDYLPASVQIECILKVLSAGKKSSKIIGVIYNPGEANSVQMVNDLKKEAHRQGITLVEATASKTSDVAPAAQNLVARGVDAIHIPNDNTAVAAIEGIIAVGEKNKVPVFAADTGSFDAGVVAIAGYDRFLLGKKAAEYAIKIIKGEKANTISVARDHPVIFQMNLNACEKMGLKLDKEQLCGFDVSTGSSKTVAVPNA
ncbi:MAG: ABC transporter substrate-binding protein [Alphaproteobacteria bacterium]|nr:ABC transporter substrate-binding protein [Alphaproteobacteria bacterium]